MPGNADSSKGNGASKRMTNAHRKLKWGKSAARRTKRKADAAVLVKLAEGRNRAARETAEVIRAHGVEAFAASLGLAPERITPNVYLTPWEQAKAARAARRAAAGLAAKYHAAEREKARRAESRSKLGKANRRRKSGRQAVAA